MIITNSRIEGKKLSRLMLPPQLKIVGTAETKMAQQPITHEITVLVKNLLIPLAIKTKANANEFERALKQEIYEDLDYVQSLKKEIDELKFEKAYFLNEFDLLLQECVSKDIMCSILCSFESLDEKTDLQCSYLEKIEECECLANEPSKQKENVSKEVYLELL
ncbi:hypothetical protein Tco_0858504 [Tanacetum coccineum]|uniref:Uncharacterized protein n=1 Tax=Tanacetum coccineum TaxID=301880 RepID=A0ABQ5BBH7_9ASTR